MVLDLQVKSRAAHVPSRRKFLAWISAALAARVDVPAELTLRVVGPTEMRTLNREYRGKDYATNVLSFPFDAPKGVVLPVRVLGDIVLCAQTVQREAAAQGKTTEAHWAHLTVHGVLHLLGLDHHTSRHAAVMEGAEIAVLATLGYANPYLTEET
ncbi:MAG: rRNA maturation RNase YbeY [Actinomycetota bacterium]|nr:rRNA maturation RNase YbeY [Actinomycetota bacterium]